MTVRHHYRITLTDDPAEVGPEVRALVATDREALPALMLAAYAGTTDDEGESLDDAVDEIDGWLRDGGRLDRSFGYERDGRLRAAALVTVVPRGAILAYAITHPDDKGAGLGRAVVTAALAHLRRDGHAEAHLWITEGNVASEALFARLGAERVDG
ncbi:MAG: GNAT family N-acetyltransferase [Actinomycetota bacterium]